MKKVTYSVLVLALVILAFSIFVQAQYTLDEYKDEVGFRGSLDPQLDPIYQIISRGIGVSAGTKFYVDNNSGSDSDNGLTWDKAFLTITVALRASHVNIATSPNFADRNIIYVRGDDFDEDLTDLAQKTDVVGVGSDDGNKGPRLLGNHTIDAVATGYNYMGCRFINMTFVNQTAADIFVVPTGHHGLEWINCRFESNSSTLAPTAIDITQCSDTRIVGCEFISSVNPMWASGAIDFGAGLCQNTDILDNFIDAAIGIIIDSSATGLSSRIEGNTIYATTLTIDENSDVFYVANNTLVSDGIKQTSFDFNMALAANNVSTQDGYTVNVPYIEPAVTPLGAVGKTYYVDGNMSADTGDGRTWENAYQKLATALAASHADIGGSGKRRWSHRNTIYVQGDEITEDLVLLAQKTDVVGVGSTSSYGMPTLIGAHAIPAAVNFMGCHFYNFQFYDDGAGGILWDLEDQSGIQFHGCKFTQNATDTIALFFEECGIDVVVDSCEFTWTNQNGWSTAAIQVLEDTDVPTDIRISNNFIRSASVGIDWDELSSVNCWVIGNIIISSGKCIDDDGNDIWCVNNRMITGIDCDSSGGDGYDFNDNRASGNLITGSGSDGQNNAPVIEAGG